MINYNIFLCDFLQADSGNDKQIIKFSPAHFSKVFQSQLGKPYSDRAIQEKNRYDTYGLSEASSHLGEQD